jgi:hypothetical protein
MAESTHFRNGVASRAAAPGQPGVAEHVWSRVKLFLSRTIFWSYERGSWQYDIMCAVILAFIFFTPRSWFRDRPTLQLSDLRHIQGVVEIGHGKNWHSYQIDSRLVESVSPEKPEEGVRQILERRLKKPVNVQSIEAIRDPNNVVLGYMVVVAQ